MSAPQVLIQSPRSSTGWWSLGSPARILSAAELDGVVPLLAEVEVWADAGGWAAGFLAYEAGPAFDPALAVHPGSGRVEGLPLAWFALGAGPAEALPQKPVDAPAVEWTAAMTRADYLTKLETIRGEIEQGNTYQVNFTMPLTTDSPPDPDHWFAAARSSHPRACQALIRVPQLGGWGPWSIVCLSPELFFHLDGEAIWSRPMKGTAAPGRDLAETRQRAQQLATSEKDRAENVMIVDMVRNDLGRIAEPGSVEVPQLFEVERHPTVLQMISTVRAKTNAPLAEIFGALFPCASITGAPKIATSRIIAELEIQPRGLYTGAVGWVGPGRQARFGVAIRTAVVAHRQGLAEYGVGSGVVWDSDPESEYRECLAKAEIVSRPVPRYELLETMLWEPSRRLVLADAHKHRLLASTLHFGRCLDSAAVDAAFEDVARKGFATPQRVRLTTSPNGEIAVETTDLEPLPNPLQVTFADLDADSDDPRLWHKTTARAIYGQALAAHPDADDVLLVNRDGLVTESTIANLVLNLDGRWLTPRRESGLLDGTLRAELLDAGVIEEAAVTPEVVRTADRIYLINSVRGWMRTELVGA